MTKTLTTLATVSALGLAAVATPQPAQARYGYGGAVAAGVIGGLAAGAIIGSAAARPYYGYGYGPGYYGYGPGPVYYGPSCWWRSQRVWDGWGWRWRRVRVCN
ncbi:MAG TPA: hypothetical protein VGJ01_18055 [Pseudolabrys sp.]